MCAARSVPIILVGKDFDAALYALKIVHEARHTRFLQNFVAWCHKREMEMSSKGKLKLDCAFTVDETLALSEEKLMELIEKLKLSQSHF